jgi:hypothetical protein
LPQIKAMASHHGRTSSTAPGVQPVGRAPHLEPRHRPLLEFDDLDARPEWDRGRQALLAFIAELNLPGAEPDAHGQRYAQWLYAGMLVSVELSYGTPVVAIEDDHRRTVFLLADVEIEELWAATGITNGPL